MSGKPGQAQVVEIPASAILPALQEGRVDAATVQVPSLTNALESGTIRSLGKSWASIAPQFHDSAYVAYSDWAVKNPQIVDRYNRALREAIAYTDHHYAETLGIIGEFTGLDPQVGSAPLRGQ